MADSGISALAPLLEGRRVSRLRRVLYVSPDGERNDFDGDLEVSVDGGPTVVLAGAPDGDTMRWEQGEWIDPFAEPLSPENREHVELTGRWVAFDVGAWPGYVHAMGETILSVEPLSRRWRDEKYREEPSPHGDAAIGARFVFGGVSIDAFSTGGDEFAVETTRDTGVSL
jgi:hypothetical protein